MPATASRPGFPIFEEGITRPQHPAGRSLFLVEKYFHPDEPPQSSGWQPEKKLRP
jgi:hypothetical protein